jgi:Pentapeptide repeats (8 copies)
MTTTALTAAQWQGWVAVVGGLAPAILGLLKYFDFRSRRERAAAAGQAFLTTVDALASTDEARRLAGAILLRRFFDPATEQGERTTPYAEEAVRVIAALLRGTEPGTLQKLLADGLAFAPSLQNADLQGCVLEEAYLGKRPDRRPDMSSADFFEANLSRASLKGARACDAVFYRATLHGTVFQDSELARADFREADLQGARFDGAQLDGARFDGAQNIPADVARRLDGGGNVPGSPARP